MSWESSLEALKAREAELKAELEEVQKQKAAEEGNALVQFNLGNQYASSYGVEPDFKEAEKWWRKAAHQGHVVAQYNLGVMYEKGQGVEQDFKEAVKWYRKAAEQGDCFGQYALGGMYSKGRGVPKDNVTAYAWYTLAEEGPADEGPMLCRFPAGFAPKRVLQLNKPANLSLKQLHEMGSAQGGWVYFLEGVRYYAKQKRSKLAKQMTHNKIAEGQKLSKEMVKKNPKLL